MTAVRYPWTVYSQVLVGRIPLSDHTVLGDLDVGEVERFPDSPPDPDKEWDWEQLVRRLMARPIQVDPPPLDYLMPTPWNYGKAGLELPQGLTNRRRIWQIVDDMDPKELDGWEGESYGPSGEAAPAA